MATITLRSSKGSPLTNNEVDANFTNLNTDKYESGNNIAAGTLSASSNLSVSGSLTLSAATVSAAGTTQGAATALTNTFNIVTSATASSADSIKLPDTATGLEVTVMNDTTALINIFPATGESIDAGSANAAVTLGAGHTLKLVGISSTKWNRLSPVIVYDSSGNRVN
tara:strand:+ start:664 stop:1167 length:504 start_codon:yes stop_codon:yes gene_type:complete